MNISLLADMAKFCDNSKEIWALIGTVINVFKIAIPILIVLMAMVDLGKAVMAGKEDEIKNAQKLLIKRLIYGILIFFVVTIVQSIFSLVMTSENDSNVKIGNKCWQCAISPKDC